MMKLLMKIFSLLLLPYNVKNFPATGDKNLFIAHRTIIVRGGMGKVERGVGGVVLLLSYNVKNVPVYCT